MITEEFKNLPQFVVDIHMMYNGGKSYTPQEIKEMIDNYYIKQKIDNRDKKIDDLLD